LIAHNYGNIKLYNKIFFVSETGKDIHLKIPKNKNSIIILFFTPQVNAFIS